jgi:radical SAM superfamily enzyme YgiQ (UPF0313 family)
MTILTGNNGIREYAERLKGLSFAIGVYRPPSEGGSASLLLRMTENCPWNQCSFCEMYKGKLFVYRTVEAIKADIDAMAAIRDELTAVSRKLGLGGKITWDLWEAILGVGFYLSSHPPFVAVFNWLCAGGRTAFLQDANSVIMRPPEFIEVLSYLRKRLPSLTRVTTYARAKTLSQRKPEDLLAIRKAGLDRVHIGLETGDDEILNLIRKGVTSAEQIDGGQKAIAAGFQVSEYWMPDIGGRERWRQHAENTARVLSTINPHYIRSRPFIPRQGTPIYEEYKAGRLHLSSPHERLEELQLMISGLEVTSKVCFDHIMNAWSDRWMKALFTQDYEGYPFPQEKGQVLERIAEGLAVPESHHTHVEDLMAIGSL